MSDSAYTWCAVPLRCIRRRHHAVLAMAFRVTRKDLPRLLAASPSKHAAGNDNSTLMRLVEGCPCLVYENDDLVGGGTELEDLLRPAGIPYLRSNAPALDFYATKTVFLGTGDEVTIWSDQGCEDPLVRIIWQHGRLILDAEALAEVDAYHRQRAALLSTAPRTARHTSQPALVPVVS